MSKFTSDDSFSLDNLRSTLIRLEDTIIFGKYLYQVAILLTQRNPVLNDRVALIERAQFSSNECIYTPGALQFKGATGERSFLEYFLWETEKVHAKVRRYTSPDEYAFTSPLPEPILPPLDYKQFLFPNDINVNDKIIHMYINSIVPVICQAGDDENYGSSATKDIECLQALSRRIHYGKFIAESKFRSNPEEYTSLAQANDRKGIYELLTNREVEKKLLDRLRRKALVYGQTFDQEREGTSAHLRIPVQAVVDLYEKWVIPLTKEVEVQYLIRRGTIA